MEDDSAPCFTCMTRTQRGLSHRLAGAPRQDRELKAPQGGSCRTKGMGNLLPRIWSRT